MTAITRIRLLLPVLLALALFPALADAAPRHDAPAAHQDVVDDVGWETEATEPPVEVDDEPVDAATDAVDDVAELPPADEGTEDGDATDEPAGDWTDEDEVETPVIEYVTGRTVAGKVAKLRRNGRAAIPRGAPRRVKLLIAAANRIVGKPYKWGGGHARLDDRGYDCSGTVSYALIRSGLLGSPMVSGAFAKWGRADAGRWITIHANRGHVYMEVAGLRLDTSALGDPAGGKGPRWRPAIGARQGFHVRHVPGL